MILLKVIAIFFLFFDVCYGWSIVEAFGSNFNQPNEENANLEKYNPDEYLNAPQLIRKYGFPAESHMVETEDGYLLTLHRIPCDRNGKKGERPVFIQHGLLSSSADFLDHGNKSLGFILADAGYDVWLGNIRGNTYSRAHISLPIDSTEYWNFSWDEMANYDLPAAFDYILNVTSEENGIFYIGHSMGTTMFFAFASLYPEKAQIVKGMIALAPVAYMTHMTSPIRYVSPFVNDIEWLSRYLGIKEFLPRGKFLHMLSRECKIMNFTKEICENIIFLLCGFDPEEFDMDYLPVVVNHAPAGTSTKTVIHYVQEIANGGNFQCYDYGPKENLQKYGTPNPPSYNITDIKVPIYLMYSDNDSMASKIDVFRLAATLPNLTGKYDIPLPNFNHVDFLFARDVVPLVYEPLLKQLENFNNNSV